MRRHAFPARTRRHPLRHPHHIRSAGQSGTVTKLIHLFGRKARWNDLRITCTGLIICPRLLTQYRQPPTDRRRRRSKWQNTTLSHHAMIRHVAHYSARADGPPNFLSGRCRCMRCALLSERALQERARLLTFNSINEHG